MKPPAGDAQWVVLVNTTVAASPAGTIAYRDVGAFPFVGIPAYTRLGVWVKYGDDSATGATKVMRTALPKLSYTVSSPADIQNYTTTAEGVTVSYAMQVGGCGWGGGRGASSAACALSSCA